MWILYQMVVAVVLALVGPVFLLRRGRHYLPTLRGRLGGYDGETVRGPLWLHAVSVGEARVAAILAAELPDDRPLLVTTITPTGQKQAGALLRSRAAVAYFPFDLGFAVKRFLDRFSPRALLLVEGDYWPLVMRYVARRQIPVAVVNGRIGDRSFGRWRKVKWLARRLFGGVEHFAVQTPLDRDRLVSLGIAAERVTVAGNLKFDAFPPEPARDAETLVSDAAQGRPVIIAGSTMAGEERTVLDAFRAAGGGGRALLVLAPRHPERWREAEAAARGGGFEVARRTELPAVGDPDVVMLDSLGELAALYRLASGAFIGGTLVPTGGHNPIEPAVFGVPVAVGPSMANFKDMAERFDEGEAWQRVAGEPQLARFFRGVIDGSAEITAIGERGRRLVDANRGATDRTIEALAPLLARTA